MDDLRLEPQEVLKRLQQLKYVLKTRDRAKNEGWWLPFIEMLTKYYACKLNTDSNKQLKEVVANNFVMFALPVALEANVLQNPIEVLEVDLLWPIDFDGLGGCEIPCEAKSRATTGAVREACRQLERSLLFLEWACKLVHGPDKNRLIKKTKPNSKINFRIVKI